MRNIAKI